MYKGEVLADHVMVLVFLVPAGGQIIEARAQSTEDCLARWKRELCGMNHLDPNSSVENFFFSVKFGGKELETRDGVAAGQRED